MLNFNATPVPELPKLYMIALIARSAAGEVLMWHTAVAAFNLENAKTGGVEALKKQDLQMFNDGQNLGGWKVQNHLELTVARIDEVLTRAYDEKSDLYEAQEKQERNDLMQTIIDTASRKLLNKYRTKFTSAEVGYLEDEIVKYESTS